MRTIVWELLHSLDWSAPPAGCGLTLWCVGWSTCVGLSTRRKLRPRLYTGARSSRGARRHEALLTDDLKPGAAHYRTHKVRARGQ
jgi:hypothetical protein